MGACQSTMTSERENNSSQATEFLAYELELHCRCGSDFGFSEDGLRETIERHGFTPSNNSPNISDYDFFLWACYNERVTVGIVRYLLEYFPAAANAADGDGRTPLHMACYNKNVTLQIIQILVDAAPDSVRTTDNDGWVPLHDLCANKTLDEVTKMEVLKLLLELHPEAIRIADNDDGYLPTHVAANHSGSPEFCGVLIDAYPGSERITTSDGLLSLHRACNHNTVATVEYLYKLYPNAINHATIDGAYPIHYAIRNSDTPTAAVEIVQFLLNCDPNVILQKSEGTISLLHFACCPNIEAGIQVTR